MLSGRVMDKHTFTLFYVSFWIFMSAVLVAWVIIGQNTLREYTCVDGSIVKDERECPTCTEDSHCGPDKYCDDSGVTNTCERVSCKFDSDCEGDENVCIYNECRPA